MLTVPYFFAVKLAFVLDVNASVKNVPRLDARVIRTEICFGYGKREIKSKDLVN